MDKTALGSFQTFVRKTDIETSKFEGRRMVEGGGGEGSDSIPARFYSQRGMGIDEGDGSRGLEVGVGRSGSFVPVHIAENKGVVAVTIVILE